MRRFVLSSLLPLIVATATSCTEPSVTLPPGPKSSTSAESVAPVTALPVRVAAVVARVEPVARQVCREQAPAGTNCTFTFFIDPRPELPPNAYQTRDSAGRPVIGLTAALLKTVRNDDELAFILGHETAHHALGHIDQTQASALEGALMGGVLASIAGGDAAAIDQAQQVGAEVAVRRFSKDLEIEADQLGALIAERAGFDALRGVEFFTRLPDPGNRFLGTHPPNAARIQAVRAILAAQGL